MVSLHHKMAAAKKRKPRKKPSRSKKKSASSRGLISTLFGWPFRIVNRITAGLPFLLRWPFRFAGWAAVLGLITLLILSAVYYTRALKFDMAQVAVMPERNIIFDVKGREIGRMHGEKRDIVSLSDISQNAQKAILAREDARFYNHGAIDPKGILRMIYQNIKRGSMAQGASTITMQLARNSFTLGGKTVDRKFLEIAVAFRIEAAYKKDEILQHYCNRIFWGHSIQGIEEASRTYFEKNASDLTLSEAALLAGIVRGPNAFSPFRDLNKAERERNTTLASMVRHNFITKSEADAAKAESITIRPEGRRIIQNSYAMSIIRQELELILARENIRLGGLNINTTLDSQLQKIAVQSLNTRLSRIENRRGYKHQTRRQFQQKDKTNRGDPSYIQGALVALDNSTGAIRTIVGGRDAGESQFNRATHAKRQVGSPETLIDDGPLGVNEIDGTRDWKLKNSDGKFKGLRPASYGLIRSRNTMSVRVGDYAGLKRTIKIAEDAGFATKIPRTPSSFLGSWEATPWEVASAYSISPNHGVRNRPYLISSITDSAGNVIYETPVINYPATRPGPTWMTSQIMREVTRSGTGSRVRSLGFKADSAGKTGTTNKYRDAWFAGYTSDLTCAVWIGMDDNSPTINGGYGSELALPVWVDLMSGAARLGYRANSLNINMPMVNCQLCNLSGKRATQGCRNTHSAYNTHVPSGVAPAENDFCPIHPIQAQPVNPHSLPPQAPRAVIVEEPLPAQPVHRQPIPAGRIPQPIPAESVR